jgi:hypothetical protein
MATFWDTLAIDTATLMRTIAPGAQQDAAAFWAQIVSSNAAAWAIRDQEAHVQKGFFSDTKVSMKRTVTLKINIQDALVRAWQAFAKQHPDRVQRGTFKINYMRAVHAHLDKQLDDARKKAVEFTFVHGDVASGRPPAYMLEEDELKHPLHLKVEYTYDA